MNLRGISSLETTVVIYVTFHRWPENFAVQARQREQSQRGEETVHLCVRYFIELTITQYTMSLDITDCLYSLLSSSCNFLLF